MARRCLPELHSPCVGGHENLPTGGQQILHGDERPEWRIRGAAQLRITRTRRLGTVQMRRPVRAPRLAGRQSAPRVLCGPVGVRLRHFDGCVCAVGHGYVSEVCVLSTVRRHRNEDRRCAPLARHPMREPVPCSRSDTTALQNGLRSRNRSETCDSTTEEAWKCRRSTLSVRLDTPQ